MLTSTPTRTARGVFRVAVHGVTTLSPGFVRVTFRGPALRHFDETGFDQRIKVVLPHDEHGYDHFPFEGAWWPAWRALDESQRNPLRTYTARAIRPADGEVDVDFVAHGDAGPASAWVSRARVGDELVLIGPDARSGVSGSGVEWSPRGASTLLLAGDETAVPAISAILSQLPQDATGCVFLEVPSRDDILPLAAPDGIDVHWLPRSGAHGETAAAAHADSPSAFGAPLVAAVRDWTARYVTAKHHGVPVDPASLRDVDIDHEILWDVPEGGRLVGDFYAWLAGEAGAIKTLRRFLVSEIGIDRQQVAFMGYWRLGKAEN